MNNEDVIRAAIKKAAENGYEITDYVYKFGNSFWDLKGNMLQPDYNIIFSFDFAKAFWKPRNYNEAEFEILRGEEFWKHHLQQMVLEEKPIDYLRKFIDTTENPTNDESSVVDKIEDDTINFSPVIFKNGKYKTNNQDIITAMTHKYKEVPCCAVCENTMIVYPVNSARPYCNICDDLVDEGTTKILI